MVEFAYKQILKCFEDTAEFESDEKNFQQLLVLGHNQIMLLERYYISGTKLVNLKVIHESSRSKREIHFH